MTLDLLIPFGILLALVVYLIYNRSAFEKDVVTTYEEKFEEWKMHSVKSSEDEQKASYKELVGLVFKKDGKIDIETFDDNTKDRIDRGKFSTKVK